MLILSIPHNPPPWCRYRFFRKVVDFALDNKLMVVHDLAYADIVLMDTSTQFSTGKRAKEVG